ncbi:MAG: peptidoglycan-binding protein [Anaerolineales bacterium]|nr:peptidoglycan-binding protein [Anaerolineales bacterium]
MIRIRFVSLAVLLSIIAISCSAETNRDTPVKVENVNITITQNIQSTQGVLPTRTQTKQIKTATLEPVKNTPTIQSTKTAFLPASCPTGKGYTWSKVFSADTSYITDIYSSGDGNYLIGGVVDANDGIWVAKINPQGELIWQKKFVPSHTRLHLAPNGNFLLSSQTGSIEIDTNGNIVQSINMERMQPNADGSNTIVDGSRVMRYTNPEKPQWSYSIDKSETFSELSSDGGVIYAYAGSYIDKSVYWMPIYTDIKVIKIYGNGYIRQSVYGKLVGYETLDYMTTTNDGGAILSGTHYYEELGIDYDIWLMKINQSGGLSWQSTLKYPPTMDTIAGLYILSQGYLVISEDYINNTLRLVKLGKNGALAWQKQVNSIRGTISIIAVADMPDGGFIMYGQTQEMKGVDFLARFNSKGELLWEKLTSFNQIDNTPDTYVETIFPLPDGNILLGGSTNRLGLGVSDSYGAWLANIKDEGEVLGFLNVSPGKFTIINTMSNRPNNLPDEIIESDPLTIKKINPKVIQTTYQALPACLNGGVSLPTLKALLSLTPSITPTPSLKRDLYLTTPKCMQGADVLLLQQRLLELGYTEVGEPDGIFGKMTQTAVRLFQEKNGLEVDGYVGPKTWQKLFSDAAISNDK